MNAILENAPLKAAVAKAILGMDPAVSDGLQDGAELVEQSAKRQHEYRDQSDALTESIEAQPVTGAFYAGGLHADVTADAQHAAAIESGAKPHIIRARRAKALRFVQGGRVIFRQSVNHPGNRPYRYLENALDRELDEAAEKVLDGACEALRDAGFEIRR